ncbi:GntR family transcriptional regulator [Streptomyces sp. NPDC101776]|uniref:GntR family transcriptional regulator n=1 Tax=Streptomyces sp. NPDC101776 TaxID=3366146 RepID=UPI003820CB6E
MMQTWQQHLRGLPVHTPGAVMDPDVRARYAEAVSQAFKAGGTERKIAAHIGCSSQLVSHLLDRSEGLGSAPGAEHVARILRARIADGTYRVGDVIPSKPRLSVELGVSPRAVRRAVAWLTGQGITATRAGRGTVVVDPDAPPTGSTLQVRRPSGTVETWHRSGVHSQHIRDTVRARIWDGTYAEGSRIPVTKDLVAEFGTTEGTVKYALKELKAKGILTTTGAREDGTFVHHSARSRMASVVDSQTTPAQPASKHVVNPQAAGAKPGHSNSKEAGSADLSPR